MAIFATIGGALTPKNLLNLKKGLIQMNHLARKVYPEATDVDTAVKVIHKVIEKDGRDLKPL